MFSAIFRIKKNFAQLKNIIFPLQKIFERCILGRTTLSSRVFFMFFVFYNMLRKVKVQNAVC